MKSSKLLTAGLVFSLLGGCCCRTCRNDDCPTVDGYHSSAAQNKQGTVGLFLDPVDANLLERRNPATLKRIHQRAQLSVTDIVVLSQIGMGSDAIIAVLNETKSSFKLTTETVLELQHEGVSYKVINYMIGS